MGTRADFWVGRGPQAEWLGSIAFDGYPRGLPDPLLRATNEAQYRNRVGHFLAATRPEQGWPWPWDDSRTTDYAYAYEAGRVFGSCFGEPWFVATDEPQWDEDLDPDGRHQYGDGPKATFPTMADRKHVARGRRSGLLTFGGTQ